MIFFVDINFRSIFCMHSYHILKNYSQKLSIKYRFIYEQFDCSIVGMAIAEECTRVNPLVVFLVSMVLLVPLDFSLSMGTLGCLSSTMQYIAMG